MEEKFVLFLIDGNCTFCNKLIVWILRKRRQNNIRFFSLQSPLSINFLKSSRINNFDFLSSSYLVTENGIYSKSRAFFKLSAHLKGPYHLFTHLRLIPKSVTDFGYDMVAKTRYLIFGKQKTLCEFSTQHYSQFMLTDEEAAIFFEAIMNIHDTAHQG